MNGLCMESMGATIGKNLSLIESFVLYNIILNLTLLMQQANSLNMALNLPFFMFFIVRPDGNSAYTKFHEQYPLQIQTDQLLGLISLFSAVNSLQKGIVHPDIVAARKDQIDLTHKSSVKSLNTTTFQIRVLDTVSGYRFVLVADNKMDSKKIDNKLEQIYKTFVNYVIKAPFMNVDNY